MAQSGNNAASVLLRQGEALTRANVFHASNRASFSAAVTPSRKSIVRKPEVLASCSTGAPNHLILLTRHSTLSISPLTPL